MFSLQLDWNNIGNSVEAFAQLCNCLMSNIILNTLNLANNNLCETCGFHLAKLLSINKYLKNIDLSWNSIGEAGATSLFKSLKENYVLLELNIQGNSISADTCAMIVEQLQQNKSNEINQQDFQNRNSSILKHVISVDTNYQTQINCLKNEYQNHIDELQTRLHIFQVKNEQQKQELEELKISCLQENKCKTMICKKVEKMKSELLLKTQSLNSIVKKISNDELSNSDDETMNSLEDFEKIDFIIAKIKKKYTDKMLKETKVHKRLLDALPKLKDELNEIKAELNNTKASTEIEIQNYFDKLKAYKKLLLNNMYHLKITQKINNDLFMKNLHQQDEINTADQTKILVLLDEKIKALFKDKSDLEIKLAKLETQSTVDVQTVQALENSLMLANEELKKFNEKQLVNKVAQKLNEQLHNNTFVKEVETLKTNLNEKDSLLKLSEEENHKLNIKYTTEVSRLQSQLQCEKDKFKEIKKENQRQVEELYLMFTQYVNKLKNNNFEDEKC
ncbi:Hypothetical protein CINCED_3A006947 [Cinara cedri]|uniref:Uncharacterized protein n=1 Tax=Cinara cedri TaxID=506608 RepID=A0A5E4MBC8_9HEMI|nr:Hypothetical protein CINCED_3A006947 [Cinara cedri]